MNAQLEDSMTVAVEMLVALCSFRMCKDYFVFADNVLLCADQIQRVAGLSIGFCR